MVKSKAPRKDTELETRSLLALVIIVVALNRLVITAHPPEPWPTVSNLLGPLVVGALIGVQLRGVPVVASLTVALAAQVALVFGESWLWGDGSLRGDISSIFLVTLFGTLWRGLLMTVAAMVAQAIMKRRFVDAPAAS